MTKKDSKNLLKKYLDSNVLIELHKNIEPNNTEFWIARHSRINELKRNV